VAATLGAYAAAGGLLTLAGWALGLRRLTDWDQNGISQMPNNAVAVTAAGVGLILWAFGLRRPSIALGAFAALIGAATLFEHLTNIDLGIDQLLLYRDWGQRGVVAPGRMGLPGSMSLMVIGLSVVFTNVRTLRRLAVAGGLLTAGIAMLSLIGYFFGADPLYRIPRLTTIASQTSTMLLALGVALVTTVADHRPMTLLTGDSAAALLVRRALPGAILGPVLLGWLGVRGQAAGLFDTAFGTAMLVLLLIAFLATLLWWSAASVWEHEAASRESQKALRAADRMKDEFLATLSHELRTPVTAIVGWSHLLLHGNLQGAEQQTAFETIRASASAQVKLIEDILDISRITTGKLRLDRKPSDLAAIIQAAVAAIRPAAEAKEIPLRLVLDQALPPAFVDSARIQQVVWNLLSNAIRFSPSGSPVEVVLRAEGAFAIIEVNDRGPGIAREFLPYAFERFRQADSSATRAYTGLGIGLSLVKDLTELHGGTVSVETALGAGARFTVRLPVRPAN